MASRFRRTLWLLLSAAMAACGAGGPEAQSPASFASAPDFTARNLEGKTVRLGEALGNKVILVSFWSTYCEPCKAEFPHLKGFYDEFKDKGFVVYGISMDGPESVSEVPAFAKRHNLTFPILFDEDSHIASMYNPKKSAPYQVLIDRKGRIIRKRDGFTPGDEVHIRKDIEAALAEK